MKNYPVLGLQNRWLNLSHHCPELTRFNIPCIIRIQGQLDMRMLQQAIDRVVMHYPALRTRFYKDKETIFQSINEEVDTAITCYQLSSPSKQEYAKKIYGLVAQPINYFASRLFDCYLIKCSSDDHTVVFSISHAISDYESSKIIFDAFVKLLKGNKASMGLRSDNYIDYIAMDKERSNKPEYLSKLDFWKQQANTVNAFKKSNENPCYPFSQDNNHCVRFTLQEKQMKILAEEKNQLGCSMASLLLGVLVLVLSHIQGKSAVSLAVPVSERRSRALASTVGFLSGPCPFAVDVCLSDSVLTYFEKIAQQLRNIAENYMPIGDINTMLENNKTQHYHYNTIFNLNAFRKPVGLDETSPLDITFPSDILHYPNSMGLGLFVNIMRFSETTDFYFNYDDRYFKPILIEHGVDCYQAILDQMNIIDKDMKLSELLRVVEHEIRRKHLSLNPLSELHQPAGVV